MAQELKGGERRQAQPFVFPEDPQSAEITFTITVEEVAGEGFRFSAVLEPGGTTLQHDHLVATFDRAPFSWIVGTYVLRSDASGAQMLHAPAGFAKNDWRSLVDRFKAELEEWRDQLVSGLQSFPSAQTIDTIARDVVVLITVASLKRLAFTDEPVTDARQAQVVGVKCASCGFRMDSGLREFLARFLGEDHLPEGVKEHNGVRFLVDEAYEPVVKIGYLTHENENPFAPCLNAELAARVRAAIAQVVDEVVLETAARNEVHRRLCASSGLSLHRTYVLDPKTLARRVLELEADALEAFAGSAAEEPNEANGDGAGDEADLDDIPSA